MNEADKVNAFTRFQFAKQEVRLQEAKRELASARLDLARIKLRAAELESQTEPLKTLVEIEPAQREIAIRAVRYAIYNKNINKKDE